MFPHVLIVALVVLVVAGLILWAVTQFPLDPVLARVIRVIVIVAVCLWLISLLLGGGLGLGYHPCR
jgi:hypothetical protein